MRNFLIRHREGIGAFAIFTGAVLLLFAPALTGTRIFAEEFTLYLNYPVYSFFGQAIGGEGLLPLWSNGYLGGFPVYLTQVGLFHPLNLLFLRLFNFFAAYHWLVVLNMILSALATYWFARLLKLGWAASVVSGLVYAFSQNVLYFASINVFSNFYPLLPLFFISVLKISEGRLRHLLLGTAALAIGLLSGFTEGVVYIVISGFAFAVFLDALRWNRAQTLIKNLRTTFACVCMAAGGGLIASFWMGSVFRFSALTLRGGGVSLEEATVADELKNGDWVKLVYPYFHVLYSKFIPFLRTSTRTGLLYFGALPLFLVLGSIFVRGKECIHRFFLWLALATFIYIIKIPFLFSIVHGLPVLNMFRGVWKWHFILNFALAVLAGFGLARLGDIRRRALHVITGIAAGVAIAATGMSLAVSVGAAMFRSRILEAAQNYFAENLYGETTGRSLSHYRALIERVFDHATSLVSPGNYHFAVALFFLLFSALMLAAFRVGRVSASYFRGGAVVAVALNFILIWQGFIGFFPQTLATVPPPSVRFLKEAQGAEEPFKVFRFHPGLATYADMGLDDLNREQIFELDIATLFPPLSLLFGIDTITANDNFMTLRQSRLLARVGSESAPAHQEDRIIHLNIPLEERLAIFTSPENAARLGMMNVRYVLSVIPFPPPWRKAFESRATRANLPVYVYENPAALPRVYFADETAQAESEEEAFQAVMRNNNFAKLTVLECASGCARGGDPAPTDAISVMELKNGYMAARVTAAHGRWLVYVDSHLPYWEAFIDGEHAPIATANYLFKAVFVPAGTHDVLFRYPGVAAQSASAFRSLFGGGAE